MKKAGLFAIMFACFTMIFTVPPADANRASMVEQNGTMSVAPTPTAYPNGNTVTNNLNRATTNVGNNVNRAMNGMENGMNRAMTGVENGVNRTVTGVENGVNRALGVRDNNAYNTNNTNNTYNRNNANMNRNNYRATANTTTANRGFSWGWLGLLGLLGLAGMRSRDRDRA
ncbi:hypothetical protein D3P07_13775 [Paenibacillus sp. 1011MAR3C5]|uniref:WGxxGxxG-CTERM domain-containing protein n=1 Tax=Paenibacillus sp. 1011MAR3C5 TaxID=1675787 RepID=UPI000E6CB7B1|nr:WGxxGxxG-CTERM domain-containing protein [Paenibacillus sp. 1011MAR3C5]RJE89017.1 hypothetical protein D3P07_13775 [Paenibacillus sp. 1011MAR3C5]